MGFWLRDSIDRIVPPFLRGPIAKKFLYSTAVVLDALIDWSLEAVDARMPGIGIYEALPHIGRDRDIDRAPAETEKQYAKRLTEAFDTWRTAGLPRTVLSQAQNYFVPLTPLMRTVSNSSVWHTLVGATLTRLHASPANWNWSGSLVPWWRAWVIIYSPSGSPFSPSPVLGSGPALGSYTGTLGSTATLSQVGAVRRLVRKWKPAHCHVPIIIVSWTSTMFDPAAAPGSAFLPDGTWENWSKYSAGVQVAARSQNAIYWSGV